MMMPLAEVAWLPRVKSIYIVWIVQYGLNDRPGCFSHW
jgi:hypothetical protein